jgi:hypothetical protein
MVAMGGRRIELESLGKPEFFGQAPGDAFGRRRTADISGADK